MDQGNGRTLMLEWALKCPKKSTSLNVSRIKKYFKILLSWPKSSLTELTFLPT